MKIRDRIQKTKDSSLIRNISKMLTGTVVGQALSTILVPIATRIYGAEYYGDLAVLISTSTIILSFLGFGLASAIMVANNDEEAQGIYKIAVYGTGIILLLLLSVMLFVAPYFKFFNTLLGYKTALILMMCSVFMSNMTNMSYAWLNRLGKFNVLLFNPIITPVINNAFLIPLGLLGYKNIGLYVGYILSQLGTLIHMQRYKGKMSYKLSPTKIKFLLKKNSDFILFQYPSGIANGVADQLPVQILSRFFGNTSVGYYSMTQRLLNIPINLIGGSITRVYFKEAADIQHKDGTARKFTYKLAKTIMLLYSIPAILIMAFGDIIVPWILGSEWNTAGIYLQIMIIWNMFNLLVHCFGGFSSVIGMQKRNMVNAIVTLLADFVALIAVSILYNNPIITLLVFVLVHVVIHVWFYNDMFSKDIDLRNKYLKLSVLRFLGVIGVVVLLRFGYSYIITLFD
jgi:O-antigen/teichoic acid export membrane protein